MRTKAASQQHRATHQRVAEGDAPRAHPDQARPLGLGEVDQRGAQQGDRAREHAQLGAVIEGRHQQARAGSTGKRRDPVTEAGQHPVRHRLRRIEGEGQRDESAPALLGGEHTGQLDQRQRAALGLGDELLTHCQRQVPRLLGEELLGGLGVQLPQPQLGQPSRGEGPVALPRGEQDCDRLVMQAACGEQQRVGRLAVQPLRVIHQAHHRARRRQLHEQAERRQPDEETVSTRHAAEAERTA